MGRRRKSLRWQQNIQLKKYSQEISLWKRFCDFLRMSNQNCILRNTTGRRHTSTWWPPSKRQNYDLHILYLIYVVHHIKKSQILFCNIYLIWSSYMSSVISSCFISWCVAIAGKEASTRICNGCPGAYNELSGIGSQWRNIWKYMENVQQGCFISHRSEKHPTMFVDRE